MKASKVLDMLNKGMYDELELYLRDEIFMEALTRDKNYDVKKRYNAMKKYFSYVVSSRKACQKPCRVEYEGHMYTSFCNSYSLVLTTESPGAIELFDNNHDGTYPNTARLINCSESENKVDFNRALAEAKSKGYKLKKSEVISNGYLLHYDRAYFRIGLLDITYSIINDGKEATVYHKEGGSTSPITIVNELGYAVIMPVRLEDGPEDDCVVIEI